MSDEILARGFLLADRVDTRRFEQARPLATAPLAIRLEDTGTAVLLRYGAVVLFNVSPGAERAFVDSLTPFLTDPFPRPEVEEMRLSLSSTGEDDVDASGMIRVKDFSVTRLQVVAEIVAKSLVLSRYETTLAAAFERIEPLAAMLELEGRIAFPERRLLRQMGEVLMTRHKMVGRVEIIEKPELIWERPEFDRIYVRLEAEYELRDRARAVERKLELIAETSEMLVELLQGRRSYRVELYIVLLIIVEIALSAYAIVVSPAAHQAG
jgi:uncharacterized Rmd1/YagE family protein